MSASLYTTQEEATYDNRSNRDPHEKHGHLTEQSDLPDTVFAFPKQRKEPLADTRYERSWSLGWWYAASTRNSL